MSVLSNLGNDIKDWTEFLFGNPGHFEHEKSAKSEFANPIEQFPKRNETLEVASRAVGRAVREMHESSAVRDGLAKSFSLGTNFLNDTVRVPDSALDKARVNAEAVQAMAQGNYLAPFSEEAPTTGHLDRMLETADEEVPVTEIAEASGLPSRSEATARVLAAANSNVVSAAHYSPDNIL